MTWTAHPIDGGSFHGRGYVTVDDGRHTVACVMTVRPSYKSDCHLIAAAPELQSAAQAAEQVLVDLIGMYGDSGAGLVVKELKSALAKARGEKS
jgi:hypothetical protein